MLFRQRNELFINHPVATLPPSKARANRFLKYLEGKAVRIEEERFVENWETRNYSGKVSKNPNGDYVVYANANPIFNLTRYAVRQCRKESYRIDISISN